MARAVSKVVFRLMLAVWLLGVVASVDAQESADQQALSTNVFDAYGNAGPAYAERRQVGLFPTDIARQRTRGFQVMGLRSNQRGGLIPFTLPGYLSAPRTETARRHSLPGLDVPREMEASYARYGGFGERRRSRHYAYLPDTIARRHHLLQATALTAPVRRAMWRHGTLTLQHPMVERSPAVEQEALPEWVGGDPLSRQLFSTAALDYTRVQVRAWQQFDERAYRPALRDFESACTLSPGDHMSRVGVLLCLVSVDSMRAAESVLEELVVRDPVGLFGYDFDLVSHYPEDKYVSAVRRDLAEYEREQEDVGAIALRVFVQWYLGDREEARLAALAIARNEPGSAYAAWASRMEAELARPAGPSPVGGSGG